MSGFRTNQQPDKQGFQLADNSVLSQDDNFKSYDKRDCSNKYLSRRNIGIIIIVVIAVLIVLALVSFKRSRQQQQDKRQHFFYEEHIGDDKKLTFPYPTAGMRTPGVPFNFTEIQPGQDYYNFQKQLDQIMKPFNVPNLSFRIQTAYQKGQEL